MRLSTGRPKRSPATPPSHHGKGSVSSQQNSVRHAARERAEAELADAGDRAAVLDAHRRPRLPPRHHEPVGGVQRPDARQAVELGADALVLLAAERDAARRRASTRCGSRCARPRATRSSGGRGDRRADVDGDAHRASTSRSTLGRLLGRHGVHEDAGRLLEAGRSPRGAGSPRRTSGTARPSRGARCARRRCRARRRARRRRRCERVAQRDRDGVELVVGGAVEARRRRRRARRGAGTATPTRAGTRRDRRRRARLHERRRRAASASTRSMPGVAEPADAPRRPRAARRRARTPARAGARSTRPRPCRWLMMATP